MSAITMEVFKAVESSLNQIAVKVGRVWYGPPGWIYFLWDGRQMKTPEPMDVMPVMARGMVQKRWVVAQVLGGRVEQV